MATSNSKQLSPWTKDERGKVYGRLTVLDLDSVQVESRWRCRCQCGNVTVVRGSDLRKGHIKSCGCLRSSQGGGYGTPEYRTWKEMKARCYNPNDTGYHLYGGRGIGICARWRRSFTNFLADMGPKPFPEATIERVDNDGSYCRENCRWASRLEQSQNTRKVRLLTHNGVTMCLRAWARELGISHATIRYRIAKGWPLEKVLSPEHYFVPPPVNTTHTTRG